MHKFRILLVLFIICQITIVFAQQDKVKNDGDNKKKSPKKEDVLSEKTDAAAQVDLISIAATRLDTTKNITTIAFGSCNKHLKPQTMWDAVATNKPDLWIWLGDIIYADTTDMRALALMYKQLKTNPEYKKLTAATPIIGVYDDHDFGANDAGKGYPMKKSSKKILMDFLNVPANAPVRKREGAYQSYTFGKGEQKVKVIVMDTRYFRDTLLPDETKVKRYIPNMEGDILGEAQWKWLEKEFKNNTANFTLLCSSIQVISDEHPHEKWGNFPNARKRLLTLIVKSKPKNLMILSGDRHMAEVSKMDLQGLDYPLYDFTSSGMTHIRSGSSEANKFRVGDMIIKKNFGLLKLVWDGPRPIVSMQVRTHGNELLQEIITKY
jgi:alkaline phosphatase D